MINPWDEITPPIKDLSARRVDHSHPLDLFWARDHLGSYLFVYEFPVGIGAYQTADWDRHDILTNIQTLKVGDGQASPGQALTFHPDLSDTTGKPWIHVNGDGSQKTHILEPLSEDPADWSYQEHIAMITENSVTGQSVIKDVNGDDYVEILVPAYDLGKIYIFTFAPAP